MSIKAVPDVFCVRPYLFSLKVTHLSCVTSVSTKASPLVPKSAGILLEPWISSIHNDPWRKYAASVSIHYTIRWLVVATAMSWGPRDQIVNLYAALKLNRVSHNITLVIQMKCSEWPMRSKKYRDTWSFNKMSVEIETGWKLVACFFLTQRL